MLAREHLLTYLLHGTESFLRN